LFEDAQGGLERPESDAAGDFPKQNVEATAGKIIKAHSEPMTLAGHPLEVTTSIGIALTKPDIQSNAIELRAQADEAMYAAKKAGRNRYCFAA
jgi:diguanylate cyclase (GGDEF)-like protein